MLWQMACTGRDWCDFVSFDSRLPEEMQLFVKRLPRDEKEIERIETEVKIFQGEVEALVNALKAKFKHAS